MDKLGLSLGQTGLPLCKIRRKPGFVPGATRPECLCLCAFFLHELHLFQKSIRETFLQKQFCSEYFCCPPLFLTLMTSVTCWPAMVLLFLVASQRRWVSGEKIWRAHRSKRNFERAIRERIKGDLKGWFETAPCRTTLATPFPALCPRILGTGFTNYGLRMFWVELRVIWKGWFETVPCRAALNTPFSALCPRILRTRFTNYGLRMFWALGTDLLKRTLCEICPKMFACLVPVSRHFRIFVDDPPPPAQLGCLAKDCSLPRRGTILKNNGSRLWESSSTTGPCCVAHSRVYFRLEVSFSYDSQTLWKI